MDTATHAATAAARLLAAAFLVSGPLVSSGLRAPILPFPFDELVLPAVSKVELIWKLLMIVERKLGQKQCPHQESKLILICAKKIFEEDSIRCKTNIKNNVEDN